MAQSNLVIVESPAKAKTIEKFLGKDYKVMSSYGHIRDLLSKDFSIDVNNDFAPIYEIPADKQEVVEKLRKAAQSAQTVWLASDEDREGEAIAWHLQQVLELDPASTRRIVFHEITKPAILEAIDHPRDIDLNLVDAQQARRVLDRIVGFELSPVLWTKIMPGLSAGRVQSVAVKLVAEREREIQNFVSEQYYRITAHFTPAGGEQNAFDAELNRRIDTHDAAVDFLTDCKDATYTVAGVQVKPVKKSPAPPFTTSTLQQEAARKLGFSVSQTMRVAQALYEAGHITYMRTDSVNLSNLALGAIGKEIKEMHGENYHRSRRYHTTSRGAQEAHEAIRPTYVSNHDIKGTAQERKLYNLIWKRTIASQMADAQLERTTLDIAVSNRSEQFVATGEVIKFDGFLKVYMESTDEDNNVDNEVKTLPKLAKNTTLDALQVVATQRFTQQPARYTEASLVRRMEELGIGRPSTYAPTISTIQQRDYVTRGESRGEKRSYEIITLKGNKMTTSTKSEVTGAEKGKLVPTDVGMVVNDFLIKYFPTIMDYNFTAKVESDFDDIAMGRERWNDEIGKFYTGFHPTIDEVSHLRLEHKVGERVLGKDPASGRTVSVKIGHYGPMVQLGSSDDEEKPRFASLLKDQSVATLTLAEALKLFELPRTLGDHNGEAVTVAVGRFGPYVSIGKTSASIPKDVNPLELTLDEAVKLVENKQATAAQSVIKTFDEEPEMQVLNGRYGPYIKYKGANYKLPRKSDAEALTLADCMAIVSDEANASKGRTTRRRTTARK